MFEWYENPVTYMLGLLFLFVGIIGFSQWKSSGVECRLYNQKFKTEYTQSDFFWGGSTIKEFLNEGKQTTQNIKISGAIPVDIQ